MRSRRQSVQGNVAIITAIAIVMLCGFAALAVDVGNMYRVRSQQRNALDAAALAGASQLNGTTSGLDRARAAAIAQARLHRVNRGSLELNAEQIQFGTWLNSAWTPRGLTEPDITNAVRIVHQTEPVSHPFGAVLGSRGAAVGATATAVGGGPGSVPCAFPLVVPECAMNQATAGDSCSYLMQMQDAPSDTIGWTAFGGNAINNNTIAQAINTACGSISADGTCSSCTQPLSRGAPINTNNGNLFTNNPNGFCRAIEDLLMRTGSPRAFKVTVPVMRTGNMQPCNPNFGNRNDQFVEGFAELTIFGVRCGNNGGVIADNPNPSMPVTVPASGKYMFGSLDCRTRVNVPATQNVFWGLTGRPRLVE